KAILVVAGGKAAGNLPVSMAPLVAPDGAGRGTPSHRGPESGLLPLRKLPTDMRAPALVPMPPLSADAKEALRAIAPAAVSPTGHTGGMPAEPSELPTQDVDPVRKQSALLAP